MGDQDGSERNRDNPTGIGGVESGHRESDGRFAKGNPGGPGPKGKKSLEQLVGRHLGPDGREAVAKALAVQLHRRALVALMKSEQGDDADLDALATDPRAEWFLRREWPVPQKIDATIRDGERVDPPELPASEERDREVAAILRGDPTTQPTAPGSDRLQ